MSNTFLITVGLIVFFVLITVAAGLIVRRSK